MKLSAPAECIPCLVSMKRGEAMKRTLLAIAAAATVALSSLAAPAPAHAQRGVAAGVAAGLIGGSDKRGPTSAPKASSAPGLRTYKGPPSTSPPGSLTVTPGNFG